MKFVSAPVPFRSWGNRQILTDEQLADDPYLAEFVKQFPRCFEYDPLRFIHIFYPEGDAP